MKIIRDEQSATLTLVPVEKDEEEFITFMAETIKPGDKIVWSGRGRDSEGDKFCTVNLYRRMEEENQENASKFILKGSMKQDKYEVNEIRNICYFGSGSLIFLGETEIDGKKAIVVTGQRCKVCSAGMINFYEVDWKTCKTCAAKCEHNYVSGPVYNRHTEHLEFREYCNKCGRSKPR